MSTTRLYLIRHAEPNQEATRGRCYGSLDVPLSDRGVRQARRLGRLLAGAGLAAIYTSPRLRARQTAAELSRWHQLEPGVDEDLCELDFGELEGRTYDEVATSDPAFFRRWMAEPTRVRFPGGESYADLQKRALRVLAATLDRHDGQLVAFVSHGGVIRAILASCLELPGPLIFRLDQAYGALNVVEWLDGVPVIRLMNGERPASG